MEKNKYICIHGHFYQPPRENPWLEDIELQDSAYPFHDWNERISEECYKTNTASRILDKEGDIIRIVNNYSSISFNFGPTLLSWMKKHQPEIYQAILDADKASIEKFNGHGSAIAQAYNHMIMPLANEKDKYTQVYWGIQDFQERFGRYPEGMWLPETAVNYDTLEILAELGIRYTILAPHQAAKIKKMENDNQWEDIGYSDINFRQAYLCNLPSGKSINVFFYNGALAHEVSFGGLLRDGKKFADSLLSNFSQDEQKPEIVHIATDGETFGHHHRFGDMALSFCLNHIKENKLAKITNYGEYLELYPPAHEVQIVDNTSWSCVHGIERWRDDCGCHTGMNPNWNQKWRKPLRETMDWLRDKTINIFEEGASAYFQDVWQSRNEYINIILNRNMENIDNFFNQFASYSLKHEEKIKALKYLEMQRNAMLMYTSCGWFFDDISRIETTQVMHYSARTMQLAKELHNIDLEPEYMERLRQAPSNVRKYQNGAKIYEKMIQPAIIDLLRVGSHYAVSTLFNGKQKNIYSYQILEDKIERHEKGQLKIAVGQAVIKSNVTLEQDKISFAVLHLGDHNVNGGVRRYQDEETYQKMAQEIKTAFNQTNVVDIIRLIDKYFKTNSYSLWYLFKDEQRKVIQKILQPTKEEVENNIKQLYAANYTVINFLKQLNIPVPQSLSIIAKEATNLELNGLFSQNLIDLEKMEKLIEEIQDWSIDIDKNTLEFNIERWVNDSIEKLHEQHDSIEYIQAITATLDKLDKIDITFYPWKAQNIYFQMKQELIPIFQEKASQGDKNASIWLEEFKKLGVLLSVGVS
jgi:alpha-amylase/alpha-mannosidase (GH57 family)